MAPRALWKGSLKLGDVECPVALYAAASTSQRVSFHVVNRRTGNRVRREYVDEDTGKPVSADDQIRGFDAGNDTFVAIEPDEISKLVPASDKTLSLVGFVKCADLDPLYFDRPYYVGPANGADDEFGLIRDALAAGKMAALTRSVLFRRLRTLAVHAGGEGLLAHSLHYDYEIRSPVKAFARIPDVKVKKEMLDLARHILKSKAETYDPAKFDDRYDTALAELVKAKMAGRKIAPPKRRREGKVVDLMEALRQSVETDGGSTRRKAG